MLTSCNSAQTMQKTELYTPGHLQPIATEQLANWQETSRNIWLCLSVGNTWLNRTTTWQLPTFSASSQLT